MISYDVFKQFLFEAAWLFGSAFAQFNYPFQPYLSQLGNVASTFVNVARGFNLFNRGGFGGYNNGYNQDVGIYENRYNRDRYRGDYRGGGGYVRGYNGGYRGGVNSNAFGGDTIINENNNYDNENNYYNDQSSNVFNEGGFSDGSVDGNESGGSYSEGDTYNEGGSDNDSNAGMDYSVGSDFSSGSDSNSGNDYSSGGDSQVEGGGDNSGDAVDTSSSDAE